MNTELKTELKPYHLEANDGALKSVTAESPERAAEDNKYWAYQHGGLCEIHELEEV